MHESWEIIKGKQEKEYLCRCTACYLTKKGVLPGLFHKAHIEQLGTKPHPLLGCSNNQFLNLNQCTDLAEGSCRSGILVQALLVEIHNLIQILVIQHYKKSCCGDSQAVE